MDMTCRRRKRDMEVNMNLYEHKIMIVDDEPALRRMVREFLQEEGFGQVVTAGSCREAEQVFRREHPHLILLDVMLPDGDGFMLLQKLHTESEVPVIFLSARDEDENRLRGLGLGADDYVTKPFKPIELLARIKAQLRRYKQYNETEKPAHTLQTEDLTLDTESRQVWVSGREVRLTRKEYGILEYMMRNKGQVLTMAQIYEAVWHEEFFCSENTVMMHIANLRNKLNWDNVHSDFIKTSWGRGYQI